MKKLLVKNIGLLATPEGKSAHRGEEQGKVKFLKDAWVLIEDGVIASVGTGAVPSVEGAEIVDAEGHLVTPGLVDAHTHLIFGGWRQNELGMKLHGKTYLEIQNAGGGIQSTTNATRPSRISTARCTPGMVRQSGISPLRADTRSRRGVPSEGTGVDRNLLPKKTVLRVANTFIRHFFRFDELQIYNMKKRLSRGEDK